jgi:hypothetical protein
VSFNNEVDRSGFQFFPSTVNIIMAVFVLGAVISMTIARFLRRRRRRSSYVTFIDGEEVEDGEQDPEPMHLIGRNSSFPARA